MDPQGGMLDRRWSASLSAPLVTALEPIGLWRVGHRRRDVAATDVHRAIARLALR